MRHPRLWRAAGEPARFPGELQLAVLRADPRMPDRDRRELPAADKSGTQVAAGTENDGQPPVKASPATRGVRTTSLRASRRPTRSRGNRLHEAAAGGRLSPSA